MSFVPAVLALFLSTPWQRSTNLTGWLAIELLSAAGGLLLLVVRLQPISAATMLPSSCRWQKIAGYLKTRLAKPKLARAAAALAPTLHTAIFTENEEQQKAIALTGERGRQGCWLTAHWLVWLLSIMLFILARGLRI